MKGNQSAFFAAAPSKFTHTFKVKAPLLELTLAPAGAPESRLNTSDCAGRSESVALAVNAICTSSLLVKLAMGLSTGAEFVFRTVMLTNCVAVSAGAPLSLTITAKL